MKQTPIDKFAKWWVSEKGQLQLRKIRGDSNITWQVMEIEKDKAKDWLTDNRNSYRANKIKNMNLFFRNWIRRMNRKPNPLITKDMEDEREYYKRVTANLARKIED